MSVSGVLGFALLVVVVPLLINEFSDLAPWLATQIVCWAARRLRSCEKTERYTEEWLADLERVPGKLTKLVHAIGVAVLGVVRLRTYSASLSWEPAPLVSPFDTDSIFGAVAPGAAQLDRHTHLRSLVRLDTPPPPHPPDRPTGFHQCDSTCVSNCPQRAENEALAAEAAFWAPSFPRRPVETDKPEDWQDLRFFRPLPYWGSQVHHRRIPYEGEDLFDTGFRTAPPVIGSN